MTFIAKPTGFDRILNANKRAMFNKVREATAKRGSRCAIYFPVSGSETIYGFEDSEFKYSTTPNFTKLLLVTGIKKSSATATLGVIDPFFGPDIHLWLIDPTMRNLPNGSLVEVTENSSLLRFKILKVNSILGGDLIFLEKYTLAPFA